MRRETQNILLVLLGGALLKIALTGTFLRYVKPALQPFIIATGAIMVLLALVSIGRDMIVARRPEPEPDGESAVASDAPVLDAHGHEHGHRQPKSPWLLLLPVLAIFLISPPALGADTVNRSGDRSAAQPNSNQKSSDFAALPSGDVIPLKLIDFVQRTAWDDSGSVNDRAVRLTGFVVRDTDPAKAGVYVARLMITCCAADASPVKVKLAGAGLDTLANDQWIQVTGKVEVGSATKATHYVPTLTVSSIQPTAAPADPYEF
ncbi:TIGR03943 family protein [Solihabitans fulvus]|uniref:TIGR03943 family protein n=1 Tax=Solihabitans fulvus TaxID=1892852 RepID=A0A5B2XQ40_9PSEU|nr:TIGR03943 family protein [Solihabitans fulvus]KAA2266058.1 TIGR03943 family protein [Solihabitans fulvus]